MPGAAVPTMSITPVRFRRLGDAAKSVVVEVLLERIGRRQVDYSELLTIVIGKQLVECRFAVQFDHEHTVPGSGPPHGR